MSFPTPLNPLTSNKKGMEGRVRKDRTTKLKASYKIPVNYVQ